MFKLVLNMRRYFLTPQAIPGTIKSPKIPLSYVPGTSISFHPSSHCWFVAYDPLWEVLYEGFCKDYDFMATKDELKPCLQETLDLLMGQITGPRDALYRFSIWRLCYGEDNMKFAQECLTLLPEEVRVPFSPPMVGRDLQNLIAL